MSRRPAQPTELRLLRSAVQENDFVAVATDGPRLAYLFNFARQSATRLFPGLAGAIVIVEDEDVVRAWVYPNVVQLDLAWRDPFADLRGLGRPGGDSQGA